MSDRWQCTTSSSQSSLTGGHSSSSYQNSFLGCEVTGSSQNSICAAVDFPRNIQLVVKLLISLESSQLQARLKCPYKNKTLGAYFNIS